MASAFVGEDWARVVHTTTREFVKEEEVNVLRNRKLTALAERRGRITYNHSGSNLDWKVRFARAAIQGYADTDVLTFQRVNRHQTANLPWRGYSIVDSMTKSEKLRNKDVSQIVDIYSSITNDLMEDIEDQFGDELYIDGNASGNGKRVHGLESFMSNSGAASGGYIGTNNDSYAGISTTLGAVAGTWSGTWPNGTGSASHDFWTPLVIDYTDTAWVATTKTWPNTCEEALRYGIVKSRRNRGKKGLLDLILLDNELYRQFLDLVATKERIHVERSPQNSELVQLGFKDVINFDGVDISFEYGVTTNVGYGINVDEMEICSLQDRLFVVEGPDYDVASKSWRFSIDMYGQCKFNPRHQVKWLSIT